MKLDNKTRFFTTKYIQFQYGVVVVVQVFLQVDVTLQKLFDISHQNASKSNKKLNIAYLHMLRAIGNISIQTVERKIASLRYKRALTQFIAIVQ